MSANDALAALSQLLALGDAPDDGAALWHAYAPGAMLYVDGGVVPRAELTADGFAERWRRAGDGPRRAAFEGLALTRIEEEAADTLVAWFTATERHDRQAVAIAAGFRRVADRWAVEWLLLDKAPYPLTFDAGRMQMLGDFSFGAGAGLSVPSTWLELSYYRHYAKPTPPLLTLEGARFGCHSSTGCCTVNFRIEVPAAAQAAVDAIPWETIRPELAGTRLEPLENGELLLKEQGERCRFLDEQNHCMVHKALGRAIFPVCAQYPFSLMPTPDGLAVSASFACGSVRANLGPLHAERADDLYERAAMTPSQVPTEFKISASRVVDWPTFRAVESSLVDLLAREELPLHRRLWMMGSILRSLDAPEALEVIATETMPVSEGPMRMLQQRLLGLFSARFADPAMRTPHDLAHDQPLEPADLLVRIMHNLIHSRQCSYYLSLTATFNMMVGLYVMALQAQAAYPDRPLAAETLRELSITFMHGKFLSMMVQLADHGIDPRHLLDDPGFGLGFLAYPHPAREKAPA